MSIALPRTCSTTQQNSLELLPNEQDSGCASKCTKEATRACWDREEADLPPGAFEELAMCHLPAVCASVSPCTATSAIDCPSRSQLPAEHSRGWHFSGLG